MEGVVVKRMDGPVTHGRSPAWLKLKPDYINKADIDAVIIGCMLGTGHKNMGKISEYLLGLAETPRTASAEPSRFVSFCR
jgi:ATP-dependent DNA ligase